MNEESDSKSDDSFDILKVKKEDQDRVNVDGNGRISIANLSAIDEKYVIQALFESDMTRKRFDAISKKATPPFPRRDGVRHVLSFTNLKMIVSFLDTIDMNEDALKKLGVSLFDKISRAINDAKLMMNIALHKKQMYYESNLVGNVRVVESY